MDGTAPTEKVVSQIHPKKNTEPSHVKCTPNVEIL